MWEMQTEEKRVSTTLSVLHWSMVYGTGPHSSRQSPALNTYIHTNTHLWQMTLRGEASSPLILISSSTKSFSLCVSYIHIKQATGPTRTTQLNV